MHETDDLARSVRIAEAVLFASSKPVEAKQLSESLPRDMSLDLVMEKVRQDYSTRGINLVKVEDAWAFRTAPDLAYLLRKDVPQQKKLSRAALEVLATIAYHQPVTRSEIEEVRGVETSKGTLDILLESGWVRLRGRRRTPGRPVTYGTTPAFLDHFSLSDLTDLPGLEELKGAGLLSPQAPSTFSMPSPSDIERLGEDEDSLSEADLEELGLLTPGVTQD